MDKLPFKSTSEGFVEKVLVVEDDPTVQEYLRKLLSSKGYTVQVVDRVDKALRLLSREWFPVVMTDLRLPDASGTEILDFVNQKDLQNAVLVVTAYGSMESAIEVLRHGAYDYIPKPFTSDILLHRVAMAMEKSRIAVERQRQAREMADLLQVTRDLTSRLIYATEEERQRISRDLHDGIGQSVSILKMTLNAIRNKLPPGAEDVLIEIDDLTGHIDNTIDEISRILKHLNPTYVEEIGLLATLQLYLETFEKRTGIEVKADLPEALPLSNPHHNLHLYRIVQEALTNIVKHSGATRVTLRLTPGAGVLHLSISDNGKGFQVHSEERPIGMGLIGMRERASCMGGKFQITSAPGQGTTIETEIPYESSSSNPR